MHDLCSFTYKNTSGVSEDRTLESFLSHPIYDYSRPYDWHLRQDYVSYSQVLMAIYCEKVGKGFPSTLENKFVSQSNASIKSRFHKLFPEEFPEHLDQKTIKIPYSLYEKCWHSAQSDATIQPYDIEICFYFTQQNNLGLNYVVDDFWDGKIGGNKHEHKIVLHVIPLMKFFSLYDWRRLQIMNAIISSQEDSDLIQRWKHTAAKTYIYHQLPDIHGLGGLAVCRANIFLSHQGALNNFYRIDKGHSLIYPLVQTSLLNQHITQSFLEWLCQQSDQSYDLRYLNIITPALETLKRNGQFLVDSREKIQKHPKSSHLMKVLFKEFPLVGILSVLLKNDPSHAHKIPDLTSVLDKQKSKDHHLHLKIHSLTPQQKSALSVKKYIPTSIDPIITDLIKSVRKDKDLHDYIAPHDLFYRNHRVEIKLKPLSAHLLPKQGLSSLQKSQDPKMSLRAIHDLNALSLVKSSVFSLHSTTAARVIAHLPAEDLQVNKDPTLDLWKITDSVGSIQAELNQNQIAAARGLVQNAVGGDVPLPKTNPIELPPPQGSTLVRMMDDWKTNYPEEYAEFQNRPKPAGRPAGVGAKGAPSAGLFDEDGKNFMLEICNLTSLERFLW